MATIPLVLLGACDEKSKPSKPASVTAQAQQAAEERVRAEARAGSSVKFRAMQVYAQAMPRSIAVCGQANLTGELDSPFIPFVSIVSYQEGEQPSFRIEQHLATTGAAATRVYVELVMRCFEGGGPSSNRQLAPSPLPPVPNEFPREFQVPSARTAPPPASAPPLPRSSVQEPSAAAASSSTVQSVTMRQNGNLHTGPAGGTPITQVVPRGMALRVFGQAPGGWYQVGTSEAWGWMHGSLLEGPP